MKVERLKQIVKEEILIHKYGGVSIINEEVTNEDEDKIRKIIRQEVSAIFFELFKKRRSWGA
tara:strand:+ start:275 stop:460 length:186 start_codon:yes stop_codon:yes gene_type:complete